MNELVIFMVWSGLKYEAQKPSLQQTLLKEAKSDLMSSILYLADYSVTTLIVYIFHYIMLILCH